MKQIHVRFPTKRIGIGFYVYHTERAMLRSRERIAESMLPSRTQGALTDSLGSVAAYYEVENSGEPGWDRIAVHLLDNKRFPLDHDTVAHEANHLARRIVEGLVSERDHVKRYKPPRGRSRGAPYRMWIEEMECYAQTSVAAFLNAWLDGVPADDMPKIRVYDVSRNVDATAS